jgi:hypothetical protein
MLGPGLGGNLDRIRARVGRPRLDRHFDRRLGRMLVRIGTRVRGRGRSRRRVQVAGGTRIHDETSLFTAPDLQDLRRRCRKTRLRCRQAASRQRPSPRRRLCRSGRRAAPCRRLTRLCQPRGRTRSVRDAESIDPSRRARRHVASYAWASSRLPGVAGWSRERLRLRFWFEAGASTARRRRRRMHGLACVCFSIVPWRTPGCYISLQRESAGTRSPASMRGAISVPGQQGLNRRRFVCFLPLDIAVGIARQCKCYSAAGLRGVPRAISPRIPPTVRRPFGWPTTAWKLLDSD